MLDFGFSEILLTSAIALVVLGPERLPKVARQVGHWMGRARAMARQLTEQLEREVSADELLKEQSKTPKAPTPMPAAPTRFATPLAADAVPPPTTGIPPVMRESPRPAPAEVWPAESRSAEAWPPGAQPAEAPPTPLPPSVATPDAAGRAETLLPLTDPHSHVQSRLDPSNPPNE